MKRNLYAALLGVLLLPLMSFAAGKSIQFGGVGTETTARVHVYIDRGDPVPKCGPNCVRYSVLVDASTFPRDGQTTISKVVVLTSHRDYDTDRELNSPVLRLSSVWRHPSSPAKSDQIVISLPLSDETRVEDLSFKLLALKEKCMNPTVPECRELEIDTQGEFSGVQLKKLQLIDVRELMRPRREDRGDRR